MNFILREFKKKRNERGFTLIELLIVIIILGILSAVVIFAAGGIGDKGQLSACRTDARTLRTAQEAAFAKDGAYKNEADLAPTYIAQQSELHNTAPSGTSYTITAVAKCAPLVTAGDYTP